MKLKNIDIHLFKILLSNKKINAIEIIKIYPENEANIKLSLNRLNSFLCKYNYGKITKENNFYILNLKSNEIFNKSLTTPPSLSSEERVVFLLLVLAFEQKINTCKIAEYFNITRNTLSNDIKIIKAKLADQNLYLKSVPWKGLFLNGSKKDIYIFSIKIILKFLVEKEANQVIYSIYEALINPFFKNYYRQFISEDLDYIFSKLSLQIVKHFNIEIDLYGVNTLKSILIYLYLNQNNDSSFKYSSIFVENFSKIKESYTETLISLLKSNILSNKKFLIDSIEFLVISIIILQKKTLFLMIENKTPKIIDNLESIFNIKFTIENKVEFITLLDISKFNYEYDIYNYHKIPKENFKFPEFLIEVLKEYSFKHNYKVLPQDFYILAHFLYNLIFEAYSKILIHKKILILDYTNNNWISTNLKSKLKKNFKFRNIDTLSVYTLDYFNLKSLESYDFIIYSPYSDTTTLFNRLASIKNKLIILDYLDYFEVSYLINKLLLTHHLENKS